MNHCKIKFGKQQHVQEFVKNLSFEEERKWKRILGKATTLLLQDKNKKAITKVRIYGDRIAIQSLLFLYVISHMFERTATIAGFLLYLTEKEIDYEILEKDVEQNTI